MTRPPTDLDVAYLEAHEQSRDLHKPMPVDDSPEAEAAARHLARGFTHPADTD